MNQSWTHSTFFVATLVVPAFLLASCSDNRSRAIPPKYSSQAGADALQAYDTNKDGFINGDELKRVPGLQASLDQVDTDHDKKISTQEIDARVKAWQDSKIAEMPVRCNVTLDGQPLSDVEVEFDPESFLGLEVPKATGKTTQSGICGITMAKEKLADPKYAGVACGWYKIRVTSISRAIPARYNTETILGCEVAPNASWVPEGEIKIELKSQ